MRDNRTSLQKIADLIADGIMPSQELVNQALWEEKENQLIIEKLKIDIRNKQISG